MGDTLRNRIAGALCAAATLLAAHPTPAASPPPPAVTVATVKLHDVAPPSSFIGRVTAIETVQLVPRVTAFIDDVPVKQGSDVKAGDVMYQLQTSQYQAAVQAAQAELESAQAGLRNAELTYGRDLVTDLENDPLIGELVQGRVTLYNSTTREESACMGRITALISSGKFYSDLGIDKLDPATDRVMICGSMHMLKDVKELVENLGFVEGSLNEPGTFVVERAFVG